MGKDLKPREPKVEATEVTEPKVETTEATEQEVAKVEETKAPEQEVAKVEEAKAPEKAPEQPKESTEAVVAVLLRKGPAFDSRTGKERPATKYLFARSEWNRIKPRIGYMGYTIIKEEI